MDDNATLQATPEYSISPFRCSVVGNEGSSYSSCSPEIPTEVLIRANEQLNVAVPHLTCVNYMILHFASSACCSGVVEIAGIGRTPPAAKGTVDCYIV